MARQRNLTLPTTPPSACLFGFTSGLLCIVPEVGWRSSRRKVVFIQLVAQQHLTFLCAEKLNECLSCVLHQLVAQVKHWVEGLCPHAFLYALEVCTFRFVVQQVGNLAHNLRLAAQVRNVSPEHVECSNRVDPCLRPRAVACISFWYAVDPNAQQLVVSLFYTSGHVGFGRPSSNFQQTIERYDIHELQMQGSSHFIVRFVYRSFRFALKGTMWVQGYQNVTAFIEPQLGIDLKTAARVGIKPKETTTRDKPFE